MAHLPSLTVLQTWFSCGWLGMRFVGRSEHSFVSIATDVVTRTSYISSSIHLLVSFLYFSQIDVSVLCLAYDQVVTRKMDLMGEFSNIIDRSLSVSLPSSLILNVTHLLSSPFYSFTFQEISHGGCLSLQISFLTILMYLLSLCFPVYLFIF